MDAGLYFIQVCGMATGAETTFLGSIYPLPPLSRDHRPEIASGTYYVKKSLYNQKKKMDPVGTPRVLLVPLDRWGLLNQRAAPPRPVNKCRLGRPPPTTVYVQGGRLKYLILNRRSHLFFNVVSAKRRYSDSFQQRLPCLLRLHVAGGDCRSSTAAKAMPCRMGHGSRVPLRLLLMTMHALRWTQVRLSGPMPK